MWKWTSLLLPIAACGFPRPADVIACTPGEFSECRGDTELTCNSTGTDYDAVQCERGCDPAAGGCRLCQASQTVCVNGKVQSCDATGAVISSEACPLGCFEDQPRCREIDPSNGLAPYLDMAAVGPDLVLNSATLLVPLGRAIGPTGQIDLHSEMVSAPQDGVPIQVFPVRSLKVTGILSIRHDSSPNDTNPAVAFVVYGDVEIKGSIQLDAVLGIPPPGAVTTGSCVGAPGKFLVDTSGFFAGSGGGGGATQGGSGGGQFFPASQGGAAFPNPDLQPLRGGCSGGAPPGFAPGYGGGVIQITSRSSIHLNANSTIETNGLIGFAGVVIGLPGDESIPGGGGSGGGILMEAPAVTLEAGATLTANGGAGTSGDWHSGTPASGRTPSLGGNCTISSDICTRGGDGGSILGPAGTAASLVYDGQEQQLNTGAGGGSVGYIRINTVNGIYLKASDIFESPTPSTGNIATR